MNRTFVVTLEIPPDMTVEEVRLYIYDAINAWKDELHREERITYLDEHSVRVTTATQKGD